MGSTNTTKGARDHARAMAGTVVETMPTVPASDWEPVPEGVDRETLTWAEVVGGGNYTSKVLARGTHVRLRDPEGDACAHVLLFNADQPFERLNVADTVKIPWQAYLGAGHPLLSDQGRILATLVADDGGRHDALAGTSSRAANEAAYGDGAAQSDTPAGRELLLVAALKHGLGPRDVAPSVSFFQGVRVQDDGALRFMGSAGANRSVTLRAELPLIVLVANVPHPLDPRPGYTCTALEVLAWRGAPTTPHDPLWSRSPELERAFLNTADYAAARGL
jgi:uncharacterized protein